MGDPVSAVASVAGSVIGASGAKKAAKTQAAAADRATELQRDMYDTTRSDLAPFRDVGGNALTRASSVAGTAPTFDFAPTQADLEATPGYQFIKSQGLRGVQASAAARGLGISGAAEKGAANYVTGLADSTYKDIFNTALEGYNAKLAGYQANLGGLEDIAGIGENAAAQTGNAGIETGKNIGENIIGAANAQGGADIYGANALAGGINNYQNYALANKLIDKSGGLYGNNSGSSYDVEAAQNGLPWSDIRLKERIEKVGEKDGIPIYHFSYRGATARFEGAMAQDLLKLRPDAVVQCGKYYAVDYKKLGIEFRRIA